jgi:hypothetical protein
MALIIKDPEAHCLAQVLAQETGETITHAVNEALRERLKRIRQHRRPEAAHPLATARHPEQGSSARPRSRTPPIASRPLAAERASSDSAGETTGLPSSRHSADPRVPPRRSPAIPVPRPAPRAPAAG